MQDGSWFPSEKVRMLDPMNNIKFDISAALSLLYKNGYLDRKSAKRIYFTHGRAVPIRRRYYGLYAYRFKKEHLQEFHEQLKINYE